jgi:aminopeptidase N
MKKSTLWLCGGALLVSCASSPPDPVGPTRKPSAPTAPSSTIAASPPVLDPPKLRLPDDAFPVRYDAELTLDPAKDTFGGLISIQISAKKPTQVIWLHAQDIAIRAASFKQDGPAAELKVKTGTDPFVGLVLPAELASGGSGVLRIEYEGKVDGERPQGIYAVSEGAGPDDRYVYSMFEPLDARRAFPCFDEPTFKVPWKLSIRVKKGHGAFANAEATGEKDEGAYKLVTFADTPPIPSYLVAFMAGPFDVVDAGTVGREKKKLRFIVPRGRGGETGYAVKVTPAIVAQLEDYFGMAYPYSKLDVAVVPRYEGTMEHPGIVALGQPLTLIKPDDESLQRKQEYANIASHELAHYWFGDYVTMKWWDDTWLNESFAQWMDSKITDAVEPSWKYGRIRLGRAAWAMRADRLASAKRMRQPVVSVEDILNAFDGNLTYQKGASVISMIEHAVTPEKWKATIRRHMEKYAWKTAAADDFISVMKESAGPDAAASFESFLNQPGVPLVTVTPVCGDAKPKLRLEQKRFLPIGTTASDALWNVPVCVRYGAGAEKGRSCTFLSEKSREAPIADLKVCPEWVVPNEDGAGYYISAYSTDAIEKLGGKGKPSLSIEERAAMTRDVGFLVSNGVFPLGKAMELIPDAVAAGDKTTLESVRSILENVHWPDLPEPLYRKYQSFARKTFTPRAKALGLTPKPNEDSGTVEMREILLHVAGILAEDAELLKGGKALAEKWLDDRKSLPPDVVDVILALAAHSNDKALFDKIVSQAKAAPTRQEKAKLLGALGTVSDKALAEKALELSLSKDFELRESMGILFGLLYSRKTRDIAYDFIKRHFDEVLQRSTNFEKPFMFSFAQAYCDGAHRADAEAFFGPRAKTVEGAERVLANALESISLCEASRKAALPSLETFLKKY